MKIVNQSQKSLSEAVAVLENGGVVICPTDTVYGFLADAANKKAVEKIFKIKKRPRSKPLAVFVKDLKMAKELAEITKNQEKTLKSKWPGKFTFVLKRKAGINLYGVKKDTIAIRIPKYKFLNNLLKKLNKPLAQTSVNISGKPPLIKISDIIEQFKKYDILIIDGGNIAENKSSKIINITNNKTKIVRK